MNTHKHTATAISFCLVGSLLVACTPQEATGQSSEMVNVTARGVLPDDGSLVDLTYVLPSNTKELLFGGITGPPAINLFDVQGIEQLTEVKTLVLRLIRPPYNRQKMVVPKGIVAMQDLESIWLVNAGMRDFVWLEQLPKLRVLSFTTGSVFRGLQSDLNFSRLNSVELIWFEDLIISDSEQNDPIRLLLGSNVRFLYIGEISVNLQLQPIDEVFLNNLAKLEKVIISRRFIELTERDGLSSLDFSAYENVALVDSEEEAEQLLPKDLRPSRIFADWQSFPTIGE